MELTGAKETQQAVQVEIKKDTFFFDADGNMAQILKVKGNQVVVQMRQFKKTIDITLFDNTTGKINETIKQEEKVKKHNCLSCKDARQEDNAIYCQRANIYIDIKKAEIECYARDIQEKDKVKFDEAIKQMEKSIDWDSTEYVNRLIGLNKEYKQREDKGETITELEQNVRDILMRSILIDEVYQAKIKRLSKQCNKILNRNFGNSDFDCLVVDAVLNQMRTYGTNTMPKLDNPVKHLYAYLFEPVKVGKVKIIRVHSYLSNMIIRPNTNASPIYHPEKENFKTLTKEELIVDRVVGNVDTTDHSYNKQLNRFEDLANNHVSRERTYYKYSLSRDNFRYKYVKSEVIDGVTVYSYDHDLEEQKYQEALTKQLSKWNNWKDNCKSGLNVEYLPKSYNDVSNYLDKKILLLKPKEQIAINLHVFEGKEIEEIEKICNRKDKTIYNWLRDAKKNLKNLILLDIDYIRKRYSKTILSEFVNNRESYTKSVNHILRAKNRQRREEKYGNKQCKGA